ncbi:MAG: ATP-binding cassette domain-containing protein [Candidatus Izemoplasmatales bacterium]
MINFFRELNGEDMLEINRVKKIYNTKQHNHIAVNNISLSLPSTGMVFILGKSGSGKSTLLNLIGGIDNCTSGEICFNGRNICDYNKKQLDNYRNYHIGFVFQEFNLIDQLSVKDNISLALEIQSNNQIEVKKEILNSLIEVDMVDFINRKASELSGGEKQRIAIARALIKRPEVILADEPTGNLDSENGLKILSLLKALSKERLVLVVTHDRYFALQFADRLIELSNGVVKSDRNIAKTNLNKKDITTYNRESLKKGNISIILLFKFLYNFLSVIRFKQILSLILFCIALFLINLGLTYYNYDFDKATMNVFDKSGVESLAIYKGNDHGGDVFYKSLDQEEINQIIDTNKDMNFFKIISRPITSYGNYNSIFTPFKLETDFYSDVLYFSNICIVNDDFNGSILYGFPLSEVGDVAITDYMGSMMVKYNVFSDVNDLTSLIGKTISDGHKQLRIRAIINTDYEDYYKESNDYSELSKNGFFVNQSLYYSTIYSTEDTYNEILHTTGKMLEVEEGFSKNILIGSPIIDFDDILVGSYPSNDNEIAISLSVLEIYLDQTIIAGDITGDYQAISEYIGESITLDLSAYNQGQVPYTITGIVDDFNAGNNIHMIFSQEMFEYLDYNNYSDGWTVGLFVDLNYKEDVFNDLIKLLNDYNLKHHNIYSNELYSMNIIIENTVPIIELVGGLFIVISLLMISSHVTYSILVKSKEIGILRSLGVHNSDIAKIYILQNFILILISYIISIFMTIAMIRIQNHEITASWSLTVGILYIDWVVFIYGLILITIMSIVSSLIPTIRISNLPPISAIRNG